LHARCRAQQGAIIAHADFGALRRALEKAADYVKFIHKNALKKTQPQYDKTLP